MKKPGLAEATLPVETFKLDEDYAKEVREALNELSALIQEGEDRGIVVSFNIGKDNRGRHAVLQCEIVKRKVL